MANLFEYAPSELSASAFWAWVLSSLTTGPSEQNGYDKSVCTLAAAFLGELGHPGLVTEVREVVVEKRLGSGCRADIALLRKEGGGNEEILCLIENKLFSTPRAKDLIAQMDRYREMLPGDVQEQAVMVGMTWRYDTEQDHANKVANGESSTLLGLKAQVELLQRLDGTVHPIIAQYRAYAESVLERRNEAIAAVSADTALRQLSERDDAAEPLATYEGQWALMEQLASGCTRALSIYNGTNRDGRPWTQARVEGYRPPKGPLFYRLDRNTRGYYLRLNYYTRVPPPNKAQVAEDLKRLSEKAGLLGHAVSGGPRLQWKGSQPNRKESTLWYLYFAEYPDMTIGELTKWFATWHERFMKVVENEYPDACGICGAAK